MAKKLKQISYPSFVVFNKPTNIKRIIRTPAGLYKIEDDSFGIFGDVSLAYDYIINVLKANPVFDAFELNPDLVEGDEFYSGDRYTYFEKHVKSKQNRVLFSYTVNDPKEAMKNAYKEFLQIHELWKENKNDWALAWQWVALHPALWHTYMTMPNYWETGNGWENHWMSVFKTKKQNKISIEHGPFLDVELQDETVTPHVQPSHDYRLDVTAESYEDAVIKFAKKLHKFYNIEGLERNPVTEG